MRLVMCDDKSFHAQFVYGKFGHAFGLLGIVGDDAVDIVQALLGEFGARHRVSDVGNAGGVVNQARWHGGTGGEVAHHGRHLGIDQTVGHLGGDARVGDVVFGNQFKGHRLAIPHQFFGIGVFNRHFDAIGRIHTPVGQGASQWVHRAYGHGNAIAIGCGFGT